MIISFVLFAISVLLTIALSVLIKLQDKWSELPHFVWNHVGGVLAICSISNFGKAAKARSTIEDRGFIRVPDTIVFSKVLSRRPYASGTIQLDRRVNPETVATFSPRSFETRLFVPFASEALLSIAEQQKFFIGPQDPEKFSAAKIAENMRDDYRLRFVAQAQRWYLEECRFVAIGIVLITLLLSVLSVGDVIHRNEMTEQAVIYTTDDNGVHETVTTKGDAENRILQPAGSEENIITRGRVSEVQLVGGGLARTCITRADGRLICGFASPSFKIGEEAFHRLGTFRMWSIAKPDGFAKGVGEEPWLISRKEAEALVATGKFKIVD